MYSEPGPIFSHMLCVYGSRNCLRCTESESQPSTSTYHRYCNVALLENAANVHLRLPTTHVFAFLANCQQPLQVANSFTSLRVLNLDFEVYEGPSSLWEESWIQKEGVLWIRTLEPDFAMTMKGLKDPNRSAGALKEIVLSGLPKIVISLYLVTQYVRLLAADGKIGIGWGAKGKRYEILNVLDDDEDGDVAERGDLEILWMNVVEAGEWIAREYRPMGGDVFFWS